MDIKDNVARIAKGEEIDLAELQAAMVDTVELELIRPMENKGGERVEHLVFEEPSGKHVEMMSQAGSQKAAVERSFRVLGECVGLSPDEVKELRSRDLTRLGVVLKYFLPETPAGVL